MRHPDPHDRSAGDQADGLRRMFAGRARQFMPLVANPHVAFSSVVLERVTTAFALAGVPVLLADAADTSPAPADLALLDLAACVERLDERTYYLAARGLPRTHVNTRGSAGSLLTALAQAVPQAEVVAIHGEAAELVRVFHRCEARPLLICSDRPDAVKHAYAACKILAQRCGLMTYDLILVAAGNSPRAGAIAASLADCIDRFLGAMLNDWALIDPASDVAEPASPDLVRLLSHQRQLTIAAASVSPHPVSASRPSEWHATLT